MKKYLIIIFILALLFISGCQVPKIGRATATPTPTASPSPSIPPVTVTRYLNCGAPTTVTLSISTSGLNSNEIIAIVDRIPYGTSIVKDSWGSITPAYILDDKLIWLFAKKPTQMLLGTLGREITQSIPARISYKVSGTSSFEFRGKWSLLADKDGLIGGKYSC